MRSMTLRLSTAAAIGTLVLVIAGPAASAQEPNARASCLAKVFQAQAVAAPQTVSDRIHFIREFFLEGSPFGQALKPLAQNSTCPQ